MKIEVIPQKAIIEWQKNIKTISIAISIFQLCHKKRKCSTNYSIDEKIENLKCSSYDHHLIIEFSFENSIQRLRIKMPSWLKFKDQFENVQVYSEFSSVIRISFVYAFSLPSECLSNITTYSSLETKKHIFKDASQASYDLCCYNCHSILSSAINPITNISPLPTGMLDMYIQEFICCSELSSQPIKSSDLLPELGELCYDPIIFTLHPQNMEASSISVIASDTQSLLDIYNHDSGFVSTTIRVYDDNLTNTTTENSVSKTKVRNDANLIEEHRGVVAMRCRQCDVYLGQARDSTCVDLTCRKHLRVTESFRRLNRSSGDGDGASSAGSKASIDSYAQARFLRHRVLCRSGKVPRMENGSTTECVISNFILRLYTTYEFCRFILFSSASPGKRRRREEEEKALVRLEECVLLNIVSSSFNVTDVIECYNENGTDDAKRDNQSLEQDCEVDHTNSRLYEAIKVSYKIISFEEVKKLQSTTKWSSIAKLPLERDEYDTVANNLNNRSMFFPPSFFSKESVSFLYV